MNDEVPHNERSGECILPILGFLANLSPEIRTNFENIYVFGYWIGRGHPNLQALLAPIVDDLENAFITGVRVRLHDQEFVSKAAVLQNDSDLRLKELILNHIGCNGVDGCDKCNFKGETVFYESGGHATKFVARGAKFENFKLEKRTNESWER